MYAMCTVTLCGVDCLVAVVVGVCMVLMTKHNRSSFGENCSKGMMLLLSWQMAVSKWLGHALVMSLDFALS